MRLYHYTKGNHIHEIIESGEIRPATRGVPKGERPIVWFSTNPVWENTVSMALGKLETERIGKGLYRIIVNLGEPHEPYAWARLRYLSHMYPAQADLLEMLAKDAGANPEEWYGTFHSVANDKWVTIEVWREGTWHFCPDLKAKSIASV